MFALSSACYPAPPSQTQYSTFSSPTQGTEAHASPAPANDNQPTAWHGWQARRKIGNRKVSRSLNSKVVKNLEAAWWFGQTIGLSFNVFVTIRPAHMDSISPTLRAPYWHGVLNKIGQFARDHGFEPAHIWSRESDRDTGLGEHLHILIHIPPTLRRQFEEVASAWYDGEGEIDIRSANYTSRRTPNGKVRSAIGYLTKNSPQAAYKTHREFRLGGPILGKRAGCTRNVDVRARAVHEARQAVQRDRDALGRSAPFRVAA